MVKILVCAYLLLPVVTCNTEAFGQVDLRTRFQKEAIDAWRKYDEAFLLVNGDCYSHLTFSKWESDRKEEFHISSNGKCRSLTRTSSSNGEWTAAVYNTTYGFFLERSDADDDWVIVRLGQLADDSELVEDLHWSIDRITHRFCNPVYLVREPLYEAVEKPYFKLVDIKPAADSTLAEVTFEYEHDRTEEDRGKFNWVQGGKMILDPSNNWVIVSADLNARDVMAQIDFSIKLENEFDTKAFKSIRLPTRCVETNVKPDSLYSQDRKCTFAIPGSLPPESDFRLSAFGIPEPAELRPQSFPWFIVGSIVTAALIALGIFLIKRKR
jgi:hypothetical protein